jgi:hypothetical protein
MFPASAAQNMLYATSAKIEGFRKSSRTQAIIREPAEFQDYLFCDDRPGMGFSPRWMSGASVRFAMSQYHVPAIVCLSSGIKMLLVHTRRIIAMMENIFAFRDRAVHEKISVSVRLNGFLAMKFKDAISSFVRATSPCPAWAELRAVLGNWTVLVYFLPEAGLRWFRMGWHSISFSDRMFRAALMLRTSWWPFHYSIEGAQCLR